MGARRDRWLFAVALSVVTAYGCDQQAAPLPEVSEVLFEKYFDPPKVRTFPATKHFPAAVTIHDEIYQIKDFSRDRVRVLMSLDASKIDLARKGVHRTDKDFAVTWVRNYGKGRVFYSGLGHREDAWDRKDVQTMWLEAIKWTLGLTSGDATPRPKPAN